MRSALTANLKWAKAELAPTLGPAEQALTVLSLLPAVLQGKVQNGLKLK